VLRPEPGNAATAARLRAIGLESVQLPLFETQPLPWTMPAGPFDGLLLTSAAAIRFAGEKLTALSGYPTLAVGPATAAAAKQAGLAVAIMGDADAAALLTQAEAAGYRRLLHLSALEGKLTADGIVAAAVPIYTAAPLAISDTAVQELAGTVALIHSPRAGARLSELTTGEARATIRLAAISPAAARTAGDGWEQVATAVLPHDDALIALARTLAD
jgi:uroporphyrinogen-III synthase